MPTLEPTEKQRKVLNFIKTFVEVEGIPPTLAEIATGLGLSSANGARAHIVLLKKKGLVTYRENSARSIKCLI